MNDAVYINVCGQILEIPLLDLTSTVYKLINDPACPVYESEQAAISGGDVYDTPYHFDISEREYLERDAQQNDQGIWHIIFFLDSISQ